jgi:glycosyltransferase involved in cell wall biosynthesis
MAEAQPFLTVVMPAYNEEANLERSAEQVLDKLAELGVTAELLIVNDASTDRTGATADELASRHPQVCALHHPVNRNIGGGFASGVARAHGEWLILIPADLALELDELRKYFAVISEADIVVGVCSGRSDNSIVRRLITWINIRAIQLLFGMRERQFNYISLYRMEVLRRIKIEYWRSAFFYAEILIKAKALGYRLVEVEIRYLPRSGGHATGARWKFIAHTMRDMIAFWWRSRLGP